MNETINNIIRFVESSKDESIHLLRNPEVIRWIYGDLSFLYKSKVPKKKDLKELEDKWGKKIFKKERPDLKLKKQWTNLFGEYLCEEVYVLMKKKVTKPEKKIKHQPDREIEDAIIEVKTGTYYTEGTAHEKILGCPFKYSDVPKIYGKPLKIFCIGGAEKRCREEYKIMGKDISEDKQEFLDFYKKRNIEFVSITDILSSMILDSEYHL